MALSLSISLRPIHKAFLMEQDNGHSNDKWIPTALAVLSSVHTGTGVYILALISVSVYPLAYALLPPLKPSSAVNIFKNTVKATNTYYKEHKSLLDGSVSIDKVEGLQTEGATLKLMHAKAYQKLSLMNVSSWIRYARDGWDIWVKARAYQREIDTLREEFKILVLQAKARAPATGSLDGQDGDDASSNRSEGPDSIV